MTSTATRHGTVERQGNRGSISFDRVLAHPVERVWQAITTPDGLADWWLPFDADIAIDLRVGGLISFSSPELGGGPMTCEILEVDAPYRLVHTHFDRSITLTWELARRDGGCRLQLTQDTPDIAAALGQGHIVGLHHSLDRLEPALDGAPVAWDWDRLPVLEREYADVLPSARQRVLDAYLAGFRAGDHEAILACLTDDVTWEIVGHATAAGKGEFDALVDGPEGAGLPRLVLDESVETDDLIVGFGSGEFDGPDGATSRFRFADAFRFRDDLVCAVVSYVVPT